MDKAQQVANYVFHGLVWFMLACLFAEVAMRYTSSVVEAYYRMRLRIAKAPAKAEEESVLE